MNPSEDHDAFDALSLEEEAQGPLLEWLARDSRDHVALFTAMAAADISPQVVDEIEAHRRAVGAILQAPASTRSVFGPSLGNERGERWRALVERGLFVFAANRSGGPYWIAEAPDLPLRVGDLPAVIGELLARQAPVALPFKHVASLMPDSIGHPRRTGMTGHRLS